MMMVWKPQARVFPLADDDNDDNGDDYNHNDEYDEEGDNDNDDYDNNDDNDENDNGFKTSSQYLPTCRRFPASSPSSRAPRSRCSPVPPEL